jgi:hypothetical protein
MSIKCTRVITKYTVPTIMFAQRFALSFKVNDRKAITEAPRNVIARNSNVASSVAKPSICSVIPRSMV